MHFTTLFSLVASATVAVATLSGNPTDHFDVLQSPEKGQNVKAGGQFKIEWDPTEKYNDEKITLKLYGGKDQGTLQEVGDIATGLDSSEGSYDWKVKSSLGKEVTYGIALILESDPKTYQMSFPFHIKKAEGGADETESSGSDHAKATGTESTATSDDETSTGSSSMATTTKSHKTTETASESETTMAPSTTDSSSATGSESTTSSSASASPSSGAAAMGANGVLALGGVAAAVLAL